MLVEIGKAQEGAGIRGLDGDQGPPLAAQHGARQSAADPPLEAEIGEPLAAAAQMQVERRPLLVPEADGACGLEIEIGILRVGLRAGHEVLDIGPQIDGGSLDGGA